MKHIIPAPFTCHACKLYVMHVLFKDHVLSLASPRNFAPAPRYNSCAAPQEFTNEEIDRELYEGTPSPRYLLMEYQAPCQSLCKGSLPVCLVAITGSLLERELMKPNVAACLRNERSCSRGGERAHAPPHALHAAAPGAVH